MNLKQMAAFKELMRTGTVSEAAKNLLRTQPAVSHLISSLEAEVGMSLFERRGGRLHPIPEANYLLAECETVLRRIDLIGENLLRMKSMERGELRVASMPGPAAFLMPEMISDYTARNQDVTATLLSRSSEAVRQLISAQQFDLGLADFDPQHSAEGSLTRSEIFEFDCLCAVPAVHPFAKMSIISAADLASEPLASLDSVHPIYRKTEQAFAMAGLRFAPQFEANLFVMLLTFVNKGLACSIVDPLTAESYRLYSNNSDQIVFRPIELDITFSVEKLTPGFRPASIIARDFNAQLQTELIRLGGKQIQ